MELTKDTYFTADLHLFHKNVIQFCNRPWETVEEMNEALIQNWNNTVSNEGTVFCLGDVALTSKTDQVIALIKRLNGKKYLMRGNHDNDRKVCEAFDAWDSYGHLKYKKHDIIMMHFPIEEWNKKPHGSIHLHGHSHGLKQEVNKTLRRFDVGVDCNNYRPVHIEDIIRDAEKIEYSVPGSAKGAGCR